MFVWMWICGESPLGMYQGRLLVRHLTLRCIPRIWASRQHWSPPYRGDAIRQNHFHQYGLYLINNVVCRLSFISPGLSKNYAILDSCMWSFMCLRLAANYVMGSHRPFTSATVNPGERSLIPSISLVFAVQLSLSLWKDLWGPFVTLVPGQLPLFKHTFHSADAKAHLLCTPLYFSN